VANFKERIVRRMGEKRKPLRRNYVAAAFVWVELGGGGKSRWLTNDRHFIENQFLRGSTRGSHKNRNWWSDGGKPEVGKKGIVRWKIGRFKTPPESYAPLKWGKGDNYEGPGKPRGFPAGKRRSVYGGGNSRIIEGEHWGMV